MKKEDYYKLKKDLPDIKAGAIFECQLDENGNNIWVLSNYNTSKIDFEFSKEEIERNKEWFEPCLFISEDGEPIFANTEVWFYEKEVLNVLYGSQISGKLKYFVNKQKAEEYIESLKPKFKVGDIVVILKEYKINEPITIINKVEKAVEYFYYTDYSGIGFNDEAIRKATEQEIISYYESQGWVEGVKVKYIAFLTDSTRNCFPTIVNLEILDNELLVNTSDGSRLPLKSFELIKESELPKSWEDLHFNRGYVLNSYVPVVSDLIVDAGFNGNKLEKHKVYFATESQAKSALAFAQLSQLVKVMNGDWIPD
jgi:hypothetical protein